MEKFIKGKAYYCGDFVNTDVMAPGRFEPYQNNEHLASVALIDYLAPIPFVNPHTTYRVIFAGREFGCGSSRETAPQALAYAGTEVIIARSFARIFFRNCINMGLLLPITYDHPFDESIIGKEVEVNITKRTFQVEQNVFEFNDFGPLTEIVEAGGLTAYNQRRFSRGQL